MKTLAQSKIKTRPPIYVQSEFKVFALQKKVFDTEVNKQQKPERKYFT